MLKVSKVRTKSGYFAFPVIQYMGHKDKIEKHIGCAQNEEQCKSLHSLVNEWLLNLLGFK